MFRVAIYLSPFTLFLTSLNLITYSVRLRSLWDHTPRFFLLEFIFSMYYLYYTATLYSKMYDIRTYTCSRKNPRVALLRVYQIDAAGALSAHRNTTSAHNRERDLQHNHNTIEPKLGKLARERERELGDAKEGRREVGKECRKPRKSGRRGMKRTEAGRGRRHPERPCGDNAYACA